MKGKRVTEISVIGQNVATQIHGNVGLERSFLLDTIAFATAGSPRARDSAVTVVVIIVSVSAVVAVFVLSRRARRGSFGVGRHGRGRVRSDYWETTVWLSISFCFLF
jgi:hypothetical protein